MNPATELAWLYSTQFFGFKLGLEGPRKLLGRFKAHPAPGVRIVHVAGTNGKGSTCAMAEMLAREAGLRTGLFTSPHLVDFRERIRVNGEMIPEEDLSRLLKDLRCLTDSWEPHPTFFELAFALAMKYFRLNEVEIIFLETGMGGRLDATNAVPKDIAVLTPIGMDHCRYLGDTLADIAREKAEIIAPGKPVVTARQDEAVMDVIEEIASERRSPLIEVREPLLGYHITLEGEHQRENAALAARALTTLGIDLRTDMVAHALANVQWPGRFERTTKNLVADGAHNEHAIRALVKTWNSLYGEQKTHVIFSAVEDKDLPAVLEGVLSLAGTIHLVPMDSPRASSPAQLAGLIPGSYNGNVKIHSTLQTGLEEACRHAEAAGIPALVTGSLYLVGEVKACLSGRDHIPTAQ